VCWALDLIKIGFKIGAEFDLIKELQDMGFGPLISVLYH
jgi:hypothetical protein